MQMSPYTTVGYLTQNLAVGQQAVGGTFISIGTNGCWLSELTVGGIDKSNAAIQIQTLGATGNSTATYNYYKGSTGIHKTDGWYIGAGATRITKDNDIHFAAGTGLWVKGATGATLTCAGEVINQRLAVKLAAGQQLLSNPFPAETSLSKITIEGIDKSNAAIQIQLLGPTGNSTATYNYYKGSTGIHKTDGWYIGAGATRITTDNDIPFAAGLGLWVKGADGAIFVFEKPF